MPLLEPNLAEDDVHVWTTSLDSSASRLNLLLAVLAAAERERAARFVQPRDRRRFIVSHGVLRMLLGAYCHCDPQNLVFENGPWGKPALRHPVSRLRFNMAHSGEIAVYALLKGTEVGIDVEDCRRELAYDAIATRYFAAPEVAAFRQLPPADRVSAFFRCWTRKEAFVKARGEGLSLALDRFVVSLGSAEPARLLSLDGSAEAAASWRLMDVPMPPGHIAALAFEGGRRELRAREWPPGS